MEKDVCLFEKCFYARNLLTCISWGQVLITITYECSGFYPSAFDHNKNLKTEHDTVREKILEGEKIGEFGESWPIRQFFIRQLFPF